MVSDAESGLQPNEDRPHTIYVAPIVNSSWPTGEKNISYTIPPGTWWPWCDYWKSPQHTLYQLANFCFVLAYSSTCSKRGVLFMHSWLILGKYNRSMT
nr:unnamed protein product [Callosobruchus chinensis]